MYLVQRSTSFPIPYLLLSVNMLQSMTVEMRTFYIKSFVLIRTFPFIHKLSYNSYTSSTAQPSFLRQRHKHLTLQLQKLDHIPYVPLLHSVNRIAMLQMSQNNNSHDKNTHRSAYEGSLYCLHSSSLLLNSLLI
jgi:hypothetical protein